MLSIIKNYGMERYIMGKKLYFFNLIAKFFGNSTVSGPPVLIKISTSKRFADPTSRTFPMHRVVYSYNFIEIPENRNTFPRIKNKKNKNLANSTEV